MTRRRRSRFSMLRCPKHGVRYYPDEGCPACQRERGEKAGNASLPSRSPETDGHLRCNALSPPGELQLPRSRSRPLPPVGLARSGIASGPDNPYVFLSSVRQSCSDDGAGDGSLRKSFIEESPPHDRLKHVRLMPAPRGLPQIGKGFQAVGLAADAGKDRGVGQAPTSGRAAYGAAHDQCQGVARAPSPEATVAQTLSPGRTLAPDLLRGPLTVLCAWAGALLSRRPRGDGRRSVSPWTAGTYTVRAPAAIRANVDQGRRWLQRRGGFPPVLVSPSRHADSIGGGQGCAGGMAGA